MAAKKGIDHRKMMELAVSVMQKSIAEPRPDGKASPLVGAVLVKGDGTVETASRGEIRSGDHAEFTILERKNPTSRLDDAILFATLEPCAPGARRHPKLGCAERIVLARIKEVWVGVEDPDPTVDRKGIKYLQENGVTVNMFDRDLQDAILEANSQFIAQAQERAAAAVERRKREPIVLSSLEAPFQGANVGDLDQSTLEAYRTALGIADAVGSAPFQQRLVRQGVLSESLEPTGFGLVLFGKEPRLWMPQAALLGTIHLAAGGEEARDFTGPAVGIPAQAIQWLRDKMPDPISRTEAKRTSANDPIFEMLREAIVNALVHREYSIAGAKCQLVVEAGKFTVKSPGLPVEPITLEQLQSFDAPMLSRNPLLHLVFAQMKLAEERGLGIKSLRTRAAAAGLPPPMYSYKAPYLELTVFTQSGAAASLPAGVLEKLTPAERAGWEWLIRRDVVTAVAYEEAMDLPNRTAKFQLKKLTDLGLLEMMGAGRATRYKVLR